jgi:hypothetical protein
VGHPHRRRPHGVAEEGGHPFLADRLRSNVTLRRELEAARSLGISRKRFLGWEPTTTYQRDDSGRVLTSTVEVEWDDEERGWMLALAEHDSDVCGGCGGYLSETTDPDAVYVIDPPVRCHRCTMRGYATSQAQELPQPQALYPVIRKRGE